MVNIDLEKLLETGAHFGHQKRRWSPKMEAYMYAIKEGIYVFDLIKTKELLEEALKVISKYSKEGKTIMFVGTKKQVKDKLKEIATEVGMPYVEERWLGGTFTNFDQIKKSGKRLEELKETLKTAKKQGYTKKERLLMQREIEKIERSFGGILDIKDLPDLMIIVDTHREKGAVAEATKSGIPIVGIVDSNADPEPITFPIPMNDDAEEALNYVLDLMKETILSSKSTKKSKTKSKKNENNS